jgi:hypothetical protein
MASVVINGDTSGSVTLSAPAVAGSTTLTLPTTSGTVLTSASSLPATQLTGTIASARLPAGSVIQVVSAAYTGQTSTTSSADITTGLTASITPTSASNKILVIVNINCRFTANSWMVLNLKRGGSQIVLWAAGLGYNISGSTNTSQFAANYLDSPATTSSTTYAVYYSNAANSGTVTVQQDSTVSSMTLIEVVA